MSTNSFKWNISFSMQLLYRKFTAMHPDLRLHKEIQGQVHVPHQVNKPPWSLNNVSRKGKSWQCHVPEDKMYGDLGKCIICLNWGFSSLTQQKQHSPGQYYFVLVVTKILVYKIWSRWFNLKPQIRIYVIELLC